MKKYIGITLPIYGPWDSEKFRARPLIYEEGGVRREKRRVKDVKSPR